MPEFQRYSPENLGNNEKTQKTLTVKRLAGELLVNKADDEEAWIKNAGIVRDMFEATGYGGTSIEGLNEVEKDANKTDKQKELAREAKEVLAIGMYEAMLDTKNEGMEVALGLGSVSMIEAGLPSDFKGIAKEIIDKTTGDTRITEVLIELDNSRQRNKNKGELGRKQFNKKLDSTYEIIDEMGGLSESGKKGQELVMTYLSMESEGINEKNEKSGEIEAIASLFSSERAESTYDTFVTAEFLQQPIQLQVDTFPPSWFRNKPDNFQGTISDWQQVIRARINITNASYIKAEVAALDGEKAKNNSYLKLSEKELKIIYEMEGVRDSMQNIVKDFFALEEDPKSKAKFLVLKGKEVNGEPWNKVLVNFRDYQQTLVTNLIESKHMSENDARGAVAVAWNFLYISNVFESADTKREIGGDCANIFGEQIRAMMHPLSKARQKFIGKDANKRKEEGSHGTEEGWGGNVGAWFADMVTWTDTSAQFVDKLEDGTMKPFPKRIGASMVEMMTIKIEDEDKKMDGAEMSLAQALIDGKKVNFNRADSNLFGNYGDKWDTFFKYYNYSTGKNLIQWGKNLNEWTNDLSDILAKIKDIKTPGMDKIQMFQDLDTPEAIGWIMLNSVGIMRSPDLMLNIPNQYDYDAFIDVILRQPRLVPEKANRDKIKHMLNAKLSNLGNRIKIKLDATSRASKAPR
ncbi:MAG TPA: hypothetical protein DF698_02485 [Candidatus Atribacteria bacterium]|nr:hypothetical protein [Candidatus Atribacteria bacterium]